MSSRVIAANIAVHSAMAESYATNEPHFRPENQAKVGRKLARLREATGPRLLDVGCGTGFITTLARDLFDEIYGIDVTQAMLDRVDVSSGNITLHRCEAESMPFDDGSFDAVSAYAFLHHLEDYRVVLREMCRVLRPGGRAYVDLEPNQRFWRAMVEADELAKHGRVQPSNVVRREIDSVLHTDLRVQREFGIEADVFNQAEYTKSILGGIDPLAFATEAHEAGFSECEVIPEWFLGQGRVMHEQSFRDAELIENFLRTAAPVSLSLFKYLEFSLRK